MDVAIAFFGNRIAIKENDGPIVFTSCDLDEYQLICDNYEFDRWNVTFCDSEAELDEIHAFDWSLT